MWHYHRTPDEPVGPREPPMATHGLVKQKAPAPAPPGRSRSVWDKGHHRRGFGARFAACPHQETDHQAYAAGPAPGENGRPGRTEPSTPRFISSRPRGHLSLARFVSINYLTIGKLLSVALAPSEAADHSGLPRAYVELGPCFPLRMWRLRGNCKAP